MDDLSVARFHTLSVCRVSRYDFITSPNRKPAMRPVLPVLFTALGNLSAAVRAPQIRRKETSLFEFQLNMSPGFGP